MLVLDSIARRYGALPSAVLGFENEYQALSVDLWAHNWSVQKENAEIKRRGR
jgi:hypothetical protein